MCGILGSFSNKSNVVIAERMQLGLDCMHHRGPDDSGSEIITLQGGSLAIGQARLSIIDLSPAGHQPMHSQDGRYSIVFNGEIYNYKELRDELKLLGYTFISDSDTEVLIACWAEWGKDCLTRLIGMFAFAILDNKNNILSCARDAFGIKPFFYKMNEKDFCFASEIPALLNLTDEQPEANLQVMYDYLVYGGYDNQEASFYKNINHLLPGHLLTIQFGDTITYQKSRWWWPSIVERKDLSFDQAADVLKSLFLKSVRLHLRSDVPVGAALSGGLDSSAVVCAMRHLEPDMAIHTFTYVAGSAKLDEEKWADKVNDFVNAIPHKIFVKPEELAADLDQMILTQGEPFVSTSIYAQYRVFREAKKNGIIVTLDGQGADELLAGYSGYPDYRFKSLWDSGKYIRALKFIKEWLTWPDRNKSEAIKIIVKSLTPGKVAEKIRDRNFKNVVPEWIEMDKASAVGIYSYKKSEDTIYENADRVLVQELRSALAGNGLASLLRHADRNAMRWSIESRVPFLTIEMAEFLLSLPESYLISQNGETKSIFRKAMRGIVPDSILDRRDKIGFATPELDLLKGQKEKVLTWILEAKNISVINYELLRSEVERVLNGEQAYSARVWRVINVCRWLNLNRVSLNK